MIKKESEKLRRLPNPVTEAEMNPSWGAQIVMPVRVARLYEISTGKEKKRDGGLSGLMLFYGAFTRSLPASQGTTSKKTEKRAIHHFPKQARVARFCSHWEGKACRNAPNKRHAWKREEGQPLSDYSFGLPPPFDKID
jgi:hypothetical protein